MPTKPTTSRTLLAPLLVLAGIAIAGCGTEEDVSLSELQTKLGAATQVYFSGIPGVTTWRIEGIRKVEGSHYSHVALIRHGGAEGSYAYESYWNYQDGLWRPNGSEYDFLNGKPVQ